MGRLLDQFGRVMPREAAASVDGPRVGKPGPFTMRRFESAETTRLNQAHWQNALGQPINSDLMFCLESLRARAAYEEANNGTIDGVMFTHSEDIVGIDGPTLQVESDDPAWNETAEEVWRDWFRAPTPNPRFSGAQLLKLWVRGLWKNGEFLAQLVTSRHAAGPVSMRLRPIHPRRLATPIGQGANPNVCMGIEFDGEGVPTRYYIQNATPAGQPLALSGEYTPVPADLIIHEFLVKEEDQGRGWPWITPGLQSAADTRDYQDQVMDAARQAADHAIVWYADGANVPYMEINESAPIRRREQQTGPPGWKPMQINPNQPATNFAEYIGENDRRIGRPVSMPLMMIRLDSSKHNYASARFDAQKYDRGCRGIQYWLSGTPRAYGCLSWLFEQVIQEARFSFAALRKTPKKTTLRWLWPTQPHVDPAKERTAERTGIETGTLPFAVAVSSQGYDEDAVFAAEVRTNQKRAALGLPPLPAPGAYLNRSAPAAETTAGGQTLQNIEDEADAVAN